MIMEKFKLIKSENLFVPNEANARLLTLSECLDRQLLISPDCHTILQLLQGRNSKLLTDGVHNYQILSGSPLLYPDSVTSQWVDGVIPLADAKMVYTALQQYVLLSQIKQSGDITAPRLSNPAKKLHWRFMDFCKNLTGLVLDIGADKPSYSAQLFSSKCEYIGLDPYAANGEFRLIAMGEILPIADETIDVVSFNTSLDHILDYHTALVEAWRVLKPDGVVVINTYAWFDRATLLTDSVHFHHFREYEIFGALSDYFELIDTRRYECPKYDSHRYTLLSMSQKKIRL